MAPNLEAFRAAASRGDLDAAKSAIWGNTPEAEISERMARYMARGPAGFADEQQVESGDIPVRIVPDTLDIPDILRPAAIQAALGIWTLSGVLTTRHASSSYGQPVLVIDGRAYGPKDAIYPQGVAAILYHPNPGPGWRSPAFETSLAKVQGVWPIQGEQW